MDSATLILIAAVVFAGAFVQGLSVLGFPFVASPVVTQIIPGTGAVGLVNALSIVQNLWLIIRTRGPIAWPVLARMAPGLLVGIGIGWAIVAFVDPRVFPVIVAVSAMASIIWLLTAHRFRGAGASIVSTVWGGAVNTVAGVGGPPIASYLVTRGLAFSGYVRTLQFTFAVIDIVSLPILGVAAPSLGALAIWLLAMLIGSLLGEALRQRLPQQRAQAIGKAVILVVCVVALIRSILVIA